MPMPREVASPSDQLQLADLRAIQAVDPRVVAARPRAAAAHLTALAFCLAIVAILAWSAGPAYGQAATTPAGSSPKGENTPLGPATRSAGDGGSTSTATDDGSAGGLVRTIVGLLIVIAVIYGITWVLKQLKTREDDASGTGLESRATLPLGPGRSVHLVRAGNEYLLLGVTDGSVQHLRTYTEEQARYAGFPLDGDDGSALVPLQEGMATTFVGRIRDMTVRR